MILFVRGSITRWEFFCRLVIIWVKYHPNTIFLPGVTLPNYESFASKEYALMMWSNSFVFKREAVQGVRAWPGWPWDSTRSMCYLHNIDELVYKEMHGIHCQYMCNGTKDPTRPTVSKLWYQSGNDTWWVSQGICEGFACIFCNWRVVCRDDLI